MEAIISEFQGRIRKIQDEIELEVKNYNELLSAIKERKQTLETLIEEHNTVQAAVDKLKE